MIASPDPQAPPPDRAGQGRTHRWPLLAALRQRYEQAGPTGRGLMWACAAGLCFAVLNANLRLLTLKLDPFQSQFLRYSMGLLVLLPVMARHGFANYWPRRVGAQFTRGGVHALGLALWFTALPHIPLADMTALSFTAPIFIMIGAWLVFKEPMRWERWLATLAGFAGVLIVVGPRLSGQGGAHHLLMLASAPVFAASFLLTKSLTRDESNGVILVWQSITVSLFSLPLAWWGWQPMSGAQWLGFLMCGVLGSTGHWCLTQSLRVADISATQSARFLDLVWSAAMGWLLFADIPSGSTLLGGVVIAAAMVWLARREAAAGKPGVATSADARAADDH